MLFYVRDNSKSSNLPLPSPSIVTTLQKLAKADELDESDDDGEIMPPLSKKERKKRKREEKLQQLNGTAHSINTNNSQVPNKSTLVIGNKPAIIKEEAKKLLKPTELQTQKPNITEPNVLPNKHKLDNNKDPIAQSIIQKQKLPETKENNNQSTVTNNINAIKPKDNNHGLHEPKTNALNHKPQVTSKMNAPTKKPFAFQYEVENSNIIIP